MHGGYRENAGRPSGSKNKLGAIREKIQQICNDNNYDPFEILIKTATDPQTPLKVRLKIAMELAQYLAPKLKAIDIDAKFGGGVTVNIVKFGDGDIPSANRLDVELGSAGG